MEDCLDQESSVISFEQLAEDIFKLTLSKPKHFEYQAGQYILLSSTDEHSNQSPSR